MSFSTIFGHFHYLGPFLLLIIGGIGFPFPEGGTLILKMPRWKFFMIDNCLVD